jgi:hypothetical protein
MISDNFLAEFKSSTEKKWSLTSLNPKIYGFQIQQGTHWNPGLSDEKIAEYENFTGARFPHDFKKFLKAMNGTDRETINIYGSSGESLAQSSDKILGTKWAEKIFMACFMPINSPLKSANFCAHD